MTLGEKIQVLRKQSGLSQEQLAAKILVTRQAISKWELSESLPDADNIVQLSEVFNVTTDYLLKNGLGAASGVTSAFESAGLEAEPVVITEDFGVGKKYAAAAKKRLPEQKESFMDKMKRTALSPMTMGILGLIIAGTGLTNFRVSDVLLPISAAAIFIGIVISFVPQFKFLHQAGAHIIALGRVLIGVGIFILIVSGIFFNHSSARAILPFASFMSWAGLGMIGFVVSRELARLSNFKNLFKKQTEEEDELTAVLKSKANRGNK